MDSYERRVFLDFLDRDEDNVERFAAPPRAPEGWYLWRAMYQRSAAMTVALRRGCDFCGKPFTAADPPVAMDFDGTRMHVACGIASESGEAPPSPPCGSGLWGFSSPTMGPPLTIAEQVRHFIGHDG